MITNLPESNGYQALNLADLKLLCKTETEFYKLNFKTGGYSKKDKIGL